MEWTIVTVIISLFGFGIAVVKPIVSLTQSITKLTTMLDTLSEDVNEMITKNAHTHGRIFEKLNEQGEHLQNHEYRISRMEETR